MEKAVVRIDRKRVACTKYPYAALRYAAKCNNLSRILVVAATEQLRNTFELGNFTISSKSGPGILKKRKIF